MPLDPKKIGDAISYFRKRAGLTQKGLADRLFISDKAVSKWERGLSIPDVAYLGKLSVLLDTDIDTLLEGKHESKDNTWKGFLCTNDNNSEITLLTMIYDKPLVYYLLSNFLLAGIHEVLIACTKPEEIQIRNLLGEGEYLGITLCYAEKKNTTTLFDLLKSNRAFFEGCHVMTILENVLLYGVSLTYLFQRAMINLGQHTIIAVPAADSPYQNQVFFDYCKHVTKNDAINTCYDYFYLPILFSSPEMLLQDLSRNFSGGDLIRMVGEKSSLAVEKGSRGIVAVYISSAEDALEAGYLVRLLQRYTGNHVACLEEIAWRRGMIDDEQLYQIGQKRQQTECGKYILRLVCNDNEKSNK